MVGLSGSGKSSIAKEFQSTADLKTVIISSDSIREEICGNIADQSRNNEVFDIFHKRIRENLEVGNSVIADATNLTIKSRRKILELTKGLEVKKICYLTTKPIENCLVDNKNREHPVPDEKIHKQMRKFQVPFYEEGFDEIFHSDTKYVDNTAAFFDLVEKTCDYGQKNPHHAFTLDEHMMKVSELFEGLGYNDDWVGSSYVHDIGKVLTQTFDEDGVAHYYGHAEAGSYFLLSHGVPPEVCFLTNYHMLPYSWTTKKTRNRWRKIFGEEKFQMLLDFHECDKKGAK